MKRNQARTAAAIAIAVPLVFGFQNCSNSYNFGSTLDTTGTALAVTVPAEIPAPSQTICNPFGTTTTPSAGAGLVADSIHYLTSAQQSTAISNFQDLWTTALGVESVHLQVNDVNVPDRYFKQGFATAAGSMLQGSDGSALTAYFGFELKGNFVLGDWAPGDYQIAVLSDDGSLLKIQGAVVNADGTTSDFSLNNDGNHSTTMGCSSQIVHVDANSSFPIEFDYYQGPPVKIGLMIIARPVPAGNVQDVACGTAPGFFDDSNYPAPSIAQQSYQDLLSRGWAPINSTHYQLPTTVAPNVCSN